MLLSPVRNAAPGGGRASGSVEKKSPDPYTVLPSRVMNSSNVQIVNHPKEIDRKMYLNLVEPWKEKLSVKKEKIHQVV